MRTQTRSSCLGGSGHSLNGIVDDDHPEKTDRSDQTERSEQVRLVVKAELDRIEQ